jgi:hypothetical protein
MIPNYSFLSNYLLAKYIILFVQILCGYLDINFHAYIYIYDRKTYVGHSKARVFS